MTESSKIRILLVDDEPDILDFMTYNLRRENFEVYPIEDSIKALSVAQEVRPHLAILDVMMPVMDGIEICKQLRNNPLHKDMVIAFLSALDADFSQITGLDAGADDYITKPIRPKVLISKVKSLLRRTFPDANTEGEIKLKDLSVNVEKYTVTTAEQTIILPRKEFELLLLLISKPNKVFRREEIYDRVWGEDIIVGERTIDVHIRRLREKLNIHNIKTIKGVGYKYEEEQI
ncbi:MAG: response regulator transcription factor [Bacteroidales bacterium]|jgi:two-component system alkaline phosphatase synthesis response regulator PhoP|nr:response regulator transcription factor [Bacteroidales bacterium]